MPNVMSRAFEEKMLLYNRSTRGSVIALKEPEETHGWFEYAGRFAMRSTKGDDSKVDDQLVIEAYF